MLLCLPQQHPNIKRTIMSTAFLCQQLLQLQSQFEPCETRQCVKGDPADILPIPFHAVFENAIHGILKVQEPESPLPGPTHVNIFNGSKGNTISLKVKSTDTIGKLKQKFLKMNPDFGGSVDLAYNGKPVEAHQTLSELQVKSGATFITFHRCHGG